MKIMAVDYGDVRTGLAVCDPTELLASPAGVIREQAFLKAAEKIAQAATEQRAELLLVGLPRNMDGTEGQRAKKCRNLAKKLREITHLPTELWDERRSTITAAEILTENRTFGKKRKEKLDEVAAVVILEHYLEYRRMAGEQSKGVKGVGEGI